MIIYHVDYIKLLGGRLHTRNVRGATDVLLRWMQTRGAHYAYVFVRRVEDEDGSKRAYWNRLINGAEPDFEKFDPKRGRK